MNNTNILIVFWVVFVFVFLTLGQINAQGLPYSKTSFCPTQIAERTLPARIHTQLNSATLIQEEINLNLRRNRTSVSYNESFNLVNDGIWDDLPNGDRIWRIKLTATDAMGLTVFFDEFHLSPGSELFVYDDIDGSLVQRYDHLANTGSNRKAVRFPMETAILELYEFYGGQCELSVSKVGYSYTDICHSASTESCYTDAMCSQYSTFNDLSHSVVQILTVDEEFTEYAATGFFINNTCNDGRPLIMTNVHAVNPDEDEGDCFIDAIEEGLLEDYAAVIFECQRPSNECNDWTVEVTDYTIADGVKLIEQCAETDMALLELKGQIPEELNFFLAGWDISQTNDEVSSALIHHADGYPKKISTDSEGDERSEWPDRPGCEPEGVGYYTFWFPQGERVFDGSSGGPLFNQTTKLVYGVHIGSTSNLYGGVCPPSTSEFQPYISVSFAIDEAFTRCDFDNHLSPETSAHVSWPGMWFSDRENTCEQVHWLGGGTGSGGTGGNDEPDCINEFDPYNNNYARCSWDPGLHSNVTIRGREFIEATRHLKARSSISTGLDNDGNGVRIGQNSDVTFHAYDYINLTDGFVVEEGAKFLAETKYCCNNWDGSEWRLANPNAEEDLERPRNTDLEMPLGLKEHTEIRGLEIYPNPNSGTFTIAGAGMERVQIMEASGKLVREMKRPFATNVEVSGLSPGLYIVRVQMADGSVESAKVVVN